MTGESSTITFEALYEIARNEKTKEEIMKVSPDIYSQIIGYLKNKTGIYKNAKNDPGFNPNELEKIKTQIINARKLIKEWYERRERKIIQLAINKSRVKTVDESSLLEEERLFLNEITKILDRYREDILLSLINLKLPSVEKIEHEINNIEEGNEGKREEVNKQNEQRDNKLKIKLLEDIPRFVGTNLEIYGPYTSGEEILLPNELAEVILKRGKAEKIN